MPVQLKLQLVSVTEDGSESTEDLLVLSKQHERLDQLGLTLAEGKQFLCEVQRRVVQQQVTAFLAIQAACPTCGRARPQGPQDASRALQVVEDLELDLDVEHASPEQRKLLKTVTEFGGYIRANASCILNYGSAIAGGKPSPVPSSNPQSIKWSANGW